MPTTPSNSYPINRIHILVLHHPGPHPPQVLDPLLVAQLLISSFPSLPDTFMVAQLLAHDAQTRGLVPPEQMARQD